MRLQLLGAFAGLALGVSALPACAGMALLMFEQKGCPYCARWDREVSGAYPRTPEGQAAPLRRLDIHDPLPEGLAIVRKPQFTPTFVLVEDGREVGRIEGYPGESFFWGLLDKMLDEAKS